MAEKWKELYTEEQINLLQGIELQLLSEFISVCDILGLDYVVYGGTLLGSVKYQGFIPWDDDIDVALPRDSYNRFVREAHSLLSKDFYLQTPYNCSRSPYPYSKLRKAGTKYIEYINRNLPIDTGVYIDIYPIDRIPDDEILRKKQFKKVRRWILVYVCRQSRLYDKNETTLVGRMKNAAKWVICNGLRVLPQRYCIGKLDYYMTMYNGYEYGRYSALNSPNYDNIYDSLYPFVRGVFEGIEVNMPADYDNHLRRRYGDYLEDIPDEEKYGHVPYFLDLGEEDR